MNHTERAMRDIDAFFDRVRVAYAYHDYDEWKHLSKFNQPTKGKNVMRQDLEKTNGQQLPALNDEAVDVILRETARSNPQLRFNAETVKYHIGEENIELGREYIADTLSWTRGWVKRVDGVIVDSRLELVTDKKPVPARKELGDLDESEWEVNEKTGLPMDPWQLQNILPLEDIETGEYLIFVTSSVGGKIGVERLCNLVGRNYKQKRQSGLPVIKLGVKDFPTSYGGMKKRPDFSVVRWHNLPPIGEDLNDAVGF